MKLYLLNVLWVVFEWKILCNLWGEGVEFLVILKLKFELGCSKVVIFSEFDSDLGLSFYADLRCVSSRIGFFFFLTVYGITVM